MTLFPDEETETGQLPLFPEETIERYRPLPYLRKRTMPAFKPRPTTFVPRYYQEEANNALLASHREGHLRTVVELPPGAGKTSITAMGARDMLGLYDYEGTILIPVPWLHLVEQTYKAMLPFFGPEQLGIIQGDRNDLGRRITIASLATLANQERLDQYAACLSEPLRAIFPDEAHRAICPSMERILRTLDPHGEVQVAGNSATPYRGADKRSLATLFTSGLIYSEGFRPLILGGYLSDVVSHDIDTNLDLSPEQVRDLYLEAEQSDLTGKQLSNADFTKRLMQSNRYEQAYQGWMQYTGGTIKTILFAQSVPDAYGFRDYFRARGVHVEVMESQTKKATRDSILAQFAPGGPLQLIVIYGVLGTGADLPHVGCILIGRLMNIGPWTQAVGRGLRLFPGKEHCLLLNLVDQHHTLMTMGKLLGQMLPPGTSLRRVLQETVEKTTKERPVEIRTGDDWAALFKRIRTQAYDVFTGDGWTLDPMTGEASKHCDRYGDLYLFPVLPGAYRVLFLSAGKRRNWLNGEPLDAYSAKTLGNQHVERLRHATFLRDEAAKPLSQQDPDARAALAQDMTEKEWAYLRRRGVGGIGEKGESYEQVQTRLTEQKARLTRLHYEQASRFLKKYGAAWSERGGRLCFDVKHNCMRLKGGRGQ